MDMDIAKVNKELKSEAVRLGLCKQWQELWKEDWPEDKMIAKYKEGIDFCLANDFPSDSFIKQNFSLEALRRGGVLIDDKRSVLNMRTIVVKGNSSVTARYNVSCVAEAYVTDDASLHVIARNQSHIIVHVLGNATVTAEQSDNAKLLVILHSRTCSLIKNGNVAIKEEMGWLR